VFHIGTSGGGGLGDPFARDPESVATDVRGRRVSRRSAHADYGVVVDEDGSLDIAATAQLRGAR
jgi:N-methylhydantoinase B